MDQMVSGPATCFSGYLSPCVSELVMGQVQKKSMNDKNGRVITLRSALITDASALLSVAKKILQTSDYLETDPEEFQVSIESEQSWIQVLSEDQGSLLLLAECDHQIIGLLDISRKNKMKVSHVGQLGMGIHKNWRGIGIGQALLDTALKWAEEQSPLLRLQLAVMSGNRAAIGLYQKLEFVEEGIQRKAIRYRNGTFADVLLMSKLLK